MPPDLAATPKDLATLVDDHFDMSGLLDFSTLNRTVLDGMRLREGTFSDTVTRLSSGLRLTSAGDDSAAWMVGVRLSNRYRGWNEATQNIQNGISLLETADTGARSVQDALARLRELAVQSANGTYGDTERLAIHNEMTVLRDGIFRTIDSTEFNQVSVLRGKSTQPPTLVDTSALATPAAGTGSTSATQTGTYSLEVTQLAQRGAVIGNQPATPLPGGDPPTVMTISGPGGVATAVITFLDPPAAWPAIINAAAAAVGVTAEIVGPATMLDDGTPLSPIYDGYLLFRTATVGSTEQIGVSTNKFLDSTGFTSTPVAGEGLDMLGNLNGVPFSARGLTISAGPGAGGASGLSLTMAAQPPLGVVGDVDVTVPPEVIEDLTHVVQYAPDHLDEHLVTIPSFRLGTLSTSGANTLGMVDLTTQTNAQAAIDVIESAMQQVLTARSAIGSHLMGLNNELVIASAGSAATETAGSRITDADMAVESTNLLQQQLLQQTSLSVLDAVHTQSAATTELVVQMLKSNPLTPATG